MSEHFWTMFAGSFTGSFLAMLGVDLVKFLWTRDAEVRWWWRRR